MFLKVKVRHLIPLFQNTIKNYLNPDQTRKVKISITQITAEQQPGTSNQQAASPLIVWFVQSNLKRHQHTAGLGSMAPFMIVLQRLLGQRERERGFF